ncbi:MAG: hypothetical protein BM564_07945 [Bacteroidetes bacterium MedPE-SWsnd-G2]|nr:MAG: hypothetical protein BM564_07945 [Bacteroidetes bacterium MedPE-SWsnd-G2]
MNIRNLSKYKKLVLSIILDIIGFITVVDIIWAPVSAFAMTQMYGGKRGKVAAVFSFIEEIVPGLDIIPSFTIMWIYTYVFQSQSDNSITKKIKS